ncbi:hypothetical protein P2W68_11360 [Chryseobacterium arthrosphaerae]|uniref:hypothetical protein n=1 Tax=Chryseobacterium arthrosphaerae TaxID=651561 RepID=UPI0023E328F1|nr:hypothetical protein [Chryseobacterium arthrosphaerae]WET00209.1 hypothetical protein P2W68_11360 [Chryseobacterium arthrosphaerae]
MKYKPLKKDLTEQEETCFYCNRRLKSLKAYVLEDLETGYNIFVGPSCIKEFISKDYNLSLIPDLTRYTEALNSRGKKENDSEERVHIQKENTLEQSEKDYKKAIEYLELREDKLAGSYNTSYTVLNKYYQIYLTNNKLETDIVRHILNIEKNAPEKFKLINLQKCYNYSFWIKVGIRQLNEEASSFLKSIESYLQINLTITDKQKKGVNKWLEKLDAIPKLK